MNWISVKEREPYLGADETDEKEARAYLKDAARAVIAYLKEGET